jgi:hypothetical protein
MIPLAEINGGEDSPIKTPESIGYSQIGWFSMRMKANAVFILLFGIAAVCVWIIVNEVNTKVCANKNVYLSNVFPPGCVALLMLLIAYYGVWEHTHWKFWKTSENKFTGDAIINSEEIQKAKTKALLKEADEQMARNQALLDKFKAEDKAARLQTQ